MKRVRYELVVAPSSDRSLPPKTMRRVVRDHRGRLVSVFAPGAAVAIRNAHAAVDEMLVESLRDPQVCRDVLHLLFTNARRSP